VWLRADLHLLLERVRKRNDRPLLATSDPEAVMRRLIDARYPVYAQADIASTAAIPRTAPWSATWSARLPAIWERTRHEHLPPRQGSMPQSARVTTVPVALGPAATTSISARA
jgi:hypothetical protein